MRSRNAHLLQGPVIDLLAPFNWLERNDEGRGLVAGPFAPVHPLEPRHLASIHRAVLRGGTDAQHDRLRAINTYPLPLNISRRATPRHSHEFVNAHHPTELNTALRIVSLGFQYPILALSIMRFFRNAW